jgi:hypothetical protein
MSLILVLSALLAFQLKHFLCDYVLQTGYIVETKRIYGHIGGLMHAGAHAIASIPAFLLLSASGTTIAILVAIEFVFHYHVDWLKAYVDTRAGWTQKDQAYWILFGFDQLIHQLTYLAFTAYLVGVL